MFISLMDLRLTLVCIPIAPLVACGKRNCPELVTPKQRYCKQHQREKWRDFSKKSKRVAFYSSKLWRQIKRQVKLEEPWCKICGRVTEMIDHIVPIRQGGSKTDRDNLQGLCNRCHARKRQKESEMSR